MENPRSQLEQKIIEKAIKEDQFRKELIADPKESIEKMFNMKLPVSLNLQVLEEDTQTVYLVLPNSNADKFTEELSDLELEAVAGGFDWSIATDCGSCNDDCKPR